jgi:hypothetical protein
MILRLLNATMPSIQNRYTNFAGPFLNSNALHRTSVPRSMECIGDWSCMLPSNQRFESRGND